jgi:hypothetical protein
LQISSDSAFSTPSSSQSTAYHVRSRFTFDPLPGVRVETSTPAADHHPPSIPNKQYNFQPVVNLILKLLILKVFKKSQVFRSESMPGVCLQSNCHQNPWNSIYVVTELDKILTTPTMSGSNQVSTYMKPTAYRTPSLNVESLMTNVTTFLTPPATSSIKERESVDLYQKRSQEQSLGTTNKRQRAVQDITTNYPPDSNLIKSNTGTTDIFANSCSNFCCRYCKKDFKRPDILSRLVASA